MAYIYSSNSPYYFDYLASCRTREEIQNDPELCKFLDDPTLKDNMELALAFKKAKNGDYDDKKEFVEYLLCNGPEIDADTIVYYREKCYQDPIYLQIAEIEFNDFSIVDELRVSKYGKSNDLEDCFTKPCNYLGPMANVVGLMGDSNNFRTLPNIFSTLVNGTDEQKKDLKAAWGNIRVHLTSKIVPSIRKACQVLYDNMYNHMKEFAEECKKAGITDSANIGDPLAIARADDVASTVKININSKLGDCARLWEHMRRFNPYDVNQNQKSTMPDEKVVDNRAPSGVAIDKVTAQPTISLLPPKKLKEAAKNGNEDAKWQQDLQELIYPITEEDYKILTDESIALSERIEFGRMLIYDVYNPKRTTLKSDIEAYKKKWADNQEALNALEKQYNDMADVDGRVRAVIDLLMKAKNQQEDQKKADSADEETTSETQTSDEDKWKVVPLNDVLGKDGSVNAAKSTVDGVPIEVIKENQEKTKQQQAENDRLLKNVTDAAEGVHESAKTPEEQKKNNAKKTPYWIREDYDDYRGLAD